MSLCDWLVDQCNDCGGITGGDRLRFCRCEDSGGREKTAPPVDREITKLKVRLGALRVVREECMKRGDEDLRVSIENKIQVTSEQLGALRTKDAIGPTQTEFAWRLERVRERRGYGDLKSFWRDLTKPFEGDEGFDISYDAVRTYHITRAGCAPREPQARYLGRVARVFDIRLEWLMWGDEAGEMTEAEEAPKRVLEKSLADLGRFIEIDDSNSMGDETP